MAEPEGALLVVHSWGRVAPWTDNEEATAGTAINSRYLFYAVQKIKTKKKNRNNNCAVKI